eukprot:GGOE01036512.1.p1 GENE.GGOE01036512.1~~GGOE01036512.1.p1  ORF type:complete len:532 (-),score=154.12 GGOE01036512.1:237-1832(-)
MGTPDAPLFGGYGTFSMTVWEATDLSRPLPSAAVRVSFGPRTKQTPVIHDDPAPIWNASLAFPVAGPSAGCRFELLDFSQAVPELIGEWQCVVGVDDAKRAQWCEFSPSGRVRVEWEYEYDDTTAPVERSYGTLTLEVVKAKALPASEFGELPDAYVVLEYGGHELQTKLKHSTCDPFWNESFEFQVMDPDDRATTRVLSEDGAAFGSATLAVEFGAEAKKGAEWIPLTVPPNAPHHEEPPPAVQLRYKFVVRKRKVNEGKKKDEDVIELGYEPRINGQVGVIPEVRLYAWYHLLQDSAFQDNFVHTLLGSYTKRVKGRDKAWTEVPYDSVDSLVEQEWKCETRLRLFNKVRSAAHKFLTAQTCFTTPEEETRDWYRWKEHSVMRAELATSHKLEKALRKMFNVVTFGTETPSNEQRSGPNASLSRRTHQIWCQHVYCAFVPGLGKKLARRLAAEDFVRYDSRHEGGEEWAFFVYMVKEVVNFWCETITEAEYQGLMGSLVPILVRAQQEFQDRPASAVSKKRGGAFPSLK